MNKWDLSGALSGVVPKLVEAAAPDKIRQMSTAAPEEMHTEEVSRLRRLGRALKDVFTRHKSLRIVLPVLALLALAVILIKPSELMRTLTVKAYAMALAEHPEEEGRSATAEEYQTKVQAALGSGRDLAEFFAESITEILSGGDSAAEHKNQLYSPLNSYMALAMLAECAGGESREEILSLLGVTDIETLREKTAAIYLANSRDTKEVKSVLYNSLWLDQALPYNEETVRTLSEKYFASSFRGEMGSDGYNKALKAWLKEATDGLLPARYLDGVSMKPDTVMALVSALNLDVKWEGFKRSASFSGTFYAVNGQRTVTYMYQDVETALCVRGKNYYAMRLRMSGNLSAWFILPDGGAGGTTPEALLQEETYQTFIKLLMQGELTEGMPHGEDLAHNYAKVHLTLPRFDITAENNLKNSFRRLGLTKALSETEADFSGITSVDSYVSDFRQAARLIANEEGIRAVSFTFGRVEPKAAILSEITLTFNRPFLFLLMSQDNLPLYAGIVNKP
ncbi:MAG: hypothetical protein J5496_09155 [Lachnospiraceae bacterium]|nr:hypothetical protein [Lachnospiraceae bacterium]